VSGRFADIDLGALEPPGVVEALDYEAILQAMKDDLAARAPQLAEVLALESEPVVKLLEVAAYRELLVRQRVNDAGRAVMLATAVGTDLDQLAALLGVARLQIDPGDPDAVPPVPPTMEADADFRRRVQLSLEGFSTAGPEGAYLFWALSADGDVRDASATSPQPGDVVVSVLSRSGDGTAPQATLDAVEATLTAEDVRPLIEATLTFRPGPDRGVVLAAAQAAAETYAEQSRAVGRDVTLSGIYAALHQEGVHAVQLQAPEADIVIADTEAPFCSLIDLYDGGVAGG